MAGKKKSAGKMPPFMKKDDMNKDDMKNGKGAVKKGGKKK